jgi:hypothetical protein
MHIVPSFPALELILIGLTTVGLAPTVVRWFVRQNKEIALQDTFLSLSPEEKEHLRNAILNDTLNQLIAAPTISTELRTLAATVATRSDRISLIQEWYTTHLRNQQEQLQHKLAN